MLQIKNPRPSALVFTVLIMALTLSVCGNNASEETGRKGELSPPMLVVLSNDGSLDLNWTGASPAADTYDVYYRQGRFPYADDVRRGIRLNNKTSPFTLTGLANNQTYSVVIMANKRGYTSSLSSVQAVRPQSPDDGGAADGVVTAPELSIIPLTRRFILEWTSSAPPANTYDVYYSEGEFETTAELKAQGKKLRDQLSPITIEGLVNGRIYSVIVSANTKNTIIDSAVRTGKPGILPAPQKSVKRGVGYDFNTAFPGAQQSQRELITWADFELLGPSLSWFYDWGHKPQARYIEEAAKIYKVEYKPMAWSDILPSDLDDYMSRNPDTRFLLAFNEPNLVSEWESAYQLPSEAAAKWPRLMNEAKKHNLKVVSPAMALVGDPPIEWMDAFLAQPEISLDDMAGISIHSYMNGPCAFREIINRFKKYGLPVWMTEWCAWDWIAWDYMYETKLGRKPDRYNLHPVHDADAIKLGTEFQIYFLSQTAMLMEQDPMLEYYAWFIPKRSEHTYLQWPFMDLLTIGNPPELTAIGLVYAHMSTCDKSIWTPSGQLIQAKDFSANNLAEWTAHTNDGWQNSITFRPTADPLGVSVLDVWFKEVEHGYMWVEYQVYAEHSGYHALTMRYSAPEDTALTVFVDGKEAVKTDLTGAQWQTEGNINLGNISRGQRTIRLMVTGGADSDFAINWLMVD